MSAPLPLASVKLFRVNFLKGFITYSHYRPRCLSTIKKTVKELLYNDESSLGTDAIAEGWLKSFRKQKHSTFFHLNDGTCSRSLQVVADSNTCDSELSLGCSVRVEGKLILSPAKGQLVEFQAKKVLILGKQDNQEYPIRFKTDYTLDQLRQYPHLKPRTEFHQNILRLRNAASMAIHKFFQDQEYIFVHTPIITSNDCEGAGETFIVQTSRNIPLPEVSTSEDVSNSAQDAKKDPDMFFGNPAYLTVSGQLHLEVITGSFRKVYSFGPTFRAESALHRYHLCEFNMIEAEIAFTENLECIMQVMESLVKEVCQYLSEFSGEEVNFFLKSSPIAEQKKNMEKLMNSKYIRMSYSDAVKILQSHNDNFLTKVDWGSDFQKEHERYLVKHLENVPVFVTDFPKTLKPFYARDNGDGRTVASVDLLVPEVGELFGGSLREERLHIINDRLDKQGLTENYQWYLDLRRFGSVPHGGFGMGFERYLQSFLGIANIKDTIPFPRWGQHCLL